MPRSLRIAQLGTRGVPASYSGFETCVEQLGARLVDRGHEVTVYCRSHHGTYRDGSFRGMKLVHLPAIRNKYLDTLSHSALSSVHALRQRYDIALYYIAGNSPVTWIPRMVGSRTILNVDGLDWKRDKWPYAAKKYIQMSERLAAYLPDAFLTDSRAVQQYYQDTMGVRPHYIPYGSNVERVPPGETLARYGLDPRRYVLFVGRLVPENGAHHIVDAFRSSNTDLKLAIVGDAPYAEAYIDSLKDRASGDPRIVFTGYVFGKGYQELGSNAYLFVESSGVGGTHPALIEAMAFGNCVIVNGTTENLETIADAGFAYDGREGGAALRPVLQALLDDPDTTAAYRTRALQRAKAVYDWDSVTEQYEDLFFHVLASPSSDRERER